MMSAHSSGIRRFFSILVVVLLASIASAGIVAASTTDLRDFAPVAFDGAVLLPGLVVIGALMSLAIDDVARSAVALVATSILGSAIFFFAVAAPGLSISGVRVGLVDRATNFALLAFLLILLFGLAGMVVAWLIEMVVRPNRW